MDGFDIERLKALLQFLTHPIQIALFVILVTAQSLAIHFLEKKMKKNGEI